MRAKLHKIGEGLRADYRRDGLFEFVATILFVLSALAIGTMLAALPTILAVAVAVRQFHLSFWPVLGIALGTAVATGIVVGLLLRARKGEPSDG